MQGKNQDGAVNKSQTCPFKNMEATKSCPTTESSQKPAGVSMHVFSTMHVFVREASRKVSMTTKVARKSDIYA